MLNCLRVMRMENSISSRPTKQKKLLFIVVVDKQSDVKM